MPDPWPNLLTFALFTMLLYLLQRWISQHIQGVGMLLFKRSNAGMALLWLVLLPGIVIHELSHWVTARLLGLKTGRFSISPKRQGKDLVLGSVEVQRSGPFKDSLVGLAPFVAGSLALLLIGYRVFDAGALGQAWDQNAWDRLAGHLAAMFDVQDAWLWIYLMFAISNAMMPSASDRESWRLVLFYLGLVTVILFLFGWLPALPDQLVQTMADGLRTLTYAFGLTIAIDLVVAAAILALELMLGALRRRRVVYK